MTRIDRTPKDPPPRRRKRWLLLSPLLVLFVWWLWPDGRLAKARALQSELFAQGGQLSPEDRRTKFEELRNVTRDMSDSQRRQLGEDMRKRREADLRQYIALSPAEKQQRLDRDIQRAEQRRQQMQNNPNAGNRPNGFGGGPGGPNGPGGRPTTPEDRERRRQERLDHSTPEFREMTDQYRRDMADRRKQLGLPPTPPGRPGR
jgi:hypothetical protein